MIIGTHHYTKHFVLVVIFLFLLAVSSMGQSDICECFRKPQDCIPDSCKREIVRIDTTLMHHSFCYQTHATDEQGRVVVLGSFCGQKPTDPFLLSFFDPKNVGTRSETWYDTAGRFIYYVRLQDDLVKECFWYHYKPDQKNYDFIYGFRNGQQFKEIYTWDEYGASYIKKIIITKKQIRTEVRTDKTDASGYIVWTSSTKPNKSGKVE